jgi:hypothetical protein
MDSQLPEKYTTLQFEGDTLITVFREGEGIAVPVRVLCEALGLDLRSQSERLRKHDVLRQGLRKELVPIEGRVREIAVILHKYIPFWLATISPHQVHEDVRPKLVRYQTELVDVLAKLYLQPKASSPTAVQRRLDEAIEDIRLLMSAQRDQEQRITNIEEIVGDLQQRTPINAAQAAYIQRAIKRIAQRYERKTGQDIFGRLFAQFQIDLGTPRYDALPAAKYDAAGDWLRAKAQQYLPDDPDVLPPMQESLL